VAAEEGVALVMNNGHAEADPDLPGRLVGVRLGVLRNVLDEAIGHLSARISDGEPLLRRQLVTGAVADIVAEAEMARRLIATPDIAHSAITDAGWDVTKLFGAAGYITDQPARALYVSALIANMWGLDR
jgi:alkylation response protein AidB-like acyl-CoA dehydrogenase